MKHNKDLQEEKDLMLTLQDLCFSYEEISVMKMQKIRDVVLSTREFFEELSHVYGRVKFSYKDSIARIEKKKKFKVDFNPSQSFISRLFFRKPTVPAKQGSVFVLLSANTKLHGSIIDEVFVEFAKQIEHEEADIMIVGRLGKDFYKSLAPPVGGKKYLYYEVPDMGFRLNDLQTLIYQLKKYERITVFHGQYLSIMKQQPTISQVSGDEGKDQASDEAENIKYLFEPSLDIIVEFFESYIFSAIFKQTMHEGQLARFASRITAMERALSSIETENSHLTVRLKHSRALFENKEQQERISGMRLWRGKT